MLDAGAEEFRQKARRQGPRRRRAVENEAHAAAGVGDRLALHQAAGIGNLDLRRATEIEDRGVEQQPGQHLVVLHRLRDVIDGEETIAGRIAGGQFVGKR
jgi:hypothetical protein